MDNRQPRWIGIRLSIVGLGTWLHEGSVDPLQFGVTSGARSIGTAETCRTEEIAVT